MEHPNPIFSFFNFAAFVIAMIYLARRPLRAMFEQQHARWQKSIGESRALASEAARRLERANERKRKLAEEIAVLQKQIAEDATRERETMLTRTRETEMRIARDAQRQAAREAERAHHALSRRVMAAAFATVEKEFSTGLSPERQHAYMESSLHHLKDLEWL